MGRDFPLIPTTIRNADPRGIAIRFTLQSMCTRTLWRIRSNGFPGDYGAGVSGVLQGVAQSDPAEGTGVCGESSQGAGICAGDYTVSGELCEGEVLWAYCDEVHQ